MQAAAKAGLLTGIIGLENFGLSPQEDNNNFQPRIGGVFDVRGNGKDIVRAGWGIYTDFGYTNSNVLFAAADATGKGFGQVFNVDQPDRHQEPRRQLLPGRPAALQHREPEPGHRRRVPAVRPVGRSAAPAAVDAQTNVGWSHELSRTRS